MLNYAVDLVIIEYPVGIKCVSCIMHNALCVFLVVDDVYKIVAASY